MKIYFNMTPTSNCKKCRDAGDFGLPITMAFQPILNLSDGTIFAQEALVRGLNGEGASEVITKVADDNRYAFDQACRVKAIELSAGLKFADHGTNLSINFLPNAIYEPRACIRLTLAAAIKYDFPVNRIIFEFTETEKVDTAHILNILRSYRAMGIQTAIDDFGSGYAGLGLLSKFQPDIVKIDMDLIRNIDTDRVKRTILASSLKMLSDLGIRAICEGVETHEEFNVLADMGVELMQGYLLGKPTIAGLTSPAWPKAA